MKHTEAEYIEAGYRFERGTMPGESVRRMIESEHIDDRADARQLIERGRGEARLTVKTPPRPSRMPGTLTLRRTHA
jgi:hypothetical protein